MPSFTTADARYAYQWQQLELSLGVANLFDKQYFTQAFGCAGGHHHADLPRSRARRSRRRCASSSERTVRACIRAAPRPAAHRLPDRGDDRVAVPARARRRASSASPATRCGRAARARKSPRSAPSSTRRSTRSWRCGPTACSAFPTCRPTSPPQLIRQGVQVTVFNQRSVEEIFSMLYQVAAMVGQEARGHGAAGAHAARGWRRSQQAAAALPRRPRVFFEEWDEPHISAIRWVSELVGIAGGDDCFPELARSRWARTASSPTAPRSCGATPTSSSAPGAARNSGAEKVAARPGWEDGERGARTASCSRSSRPTSCSPGPAALTDGVEQLHRIIVRVEPGPWLSRRSGATALDSP